MTHRQIEASRELRLWIGQVIIPAVTVIGIAMSKPEIRNAVNKKTEELKESIIRKLRKEKKQKTRDYYI